MKQTLEQELFLEKALRKYGLMKDEDILRNVFIPQNIEHNPVYPDIIDAVYHFQIHYKSGPTLHIKRIAMFDLRKLSTECNSRPVTHITYCKLIGSGGLECGNISYYDKNGDIEGLENFNTPVTHYGQKTNNFSYVGIDTQFKMILLDTLIYQVMTGWYSDIEMDITSDYDDTWRDIHKFLPV